jgi:hypothetical protein
MYKAYVDSGLNRMASISRIAFPYAHLYHISSMLLSIDTARPETPNSYLSLSSSH